MSGELTVSTSTFVNMSSPLTVGLEIAGSLVQGKLYAPEIDHAINAAEELGLGLEIAYRVGLKRAIGKIQNTGAPIHQVHGPVAWDLKSTISEAVGTNKDNKTLKGKIMDVAQGIGMAKLANGTISLDWDETKKLAREFGAKSIVLHPNGAEILYKNRGVIFGPDDQLVVAIEPDFRRLTEKSGIIWEPEDVIRIANITDQGVLLDTSHTGITFNKLNSMFDLYEIFKKEVKRGVVAIHFSVAIPGENRNEFFTSNPGTGARPLYRDTPDWIKGAYREFYQMVMKDKDFNGPFVFEMWSFPKGNSMDARQKAVEETLEVLEGSNTPDRSYR